MPLPPDVKEAALVACGRCCAICHRFCGTKIEVHHIREESEGGDNSADNAIPLCFDCHADMRSYDHKHPKGNKYTETELKKHRDNWYARVAGNVGVADRQAVVETDKAVYGALVSLLPWEGCIDFIRTYNFTGFSFENARLYPLHEFIHRYKDPALEFVDPDLEALRSDLYTHVELFMRTIAFQTFSTGAPGWNAVPEEWEQEQPERFGKVVGTLHSEAEHIVQTYGTMVRTATRKLGVLPLRVSKDSSGSSDT